MSIERRDSATPPILPAGAADANHSGNPEDTASESLEPTVGARSNQEMSIKRSHIVAMAAAGLIVCFFLPWVKILFATPSGFDIAKEVRGGILFWIMPIASALTFIAVALNQRYQIVGQLAAITPFLALAYGVYLGTDIFQFIQAGGWIALGLGVILFVAARK